MSVAAEAYRRMFEALGPQRWWPAESPFEVMAGAVLVQQTAWRNVERAIANLRDAGALEPRRLAQLAQADLEVLVRPAGYYRVKARRLRNLVKFVLERYGGSLEAMRAERVDSLRAELLAIHGIGPETADSILLYALDKPVLVVDAYAKRIWMRHGWIDAEADYGRLQETLAGELPVDAALFNELHALAVAVGKRWCKARPECETCPLREMLPPEGVVDHC